MCPGNKYYGPLLWLGSPRGKIQAVVRIHVVGILGPPMGFDPYGPFEWGVRPKSMEPIMPPFFRMGSSIFPCWKNIVFLTWLSSGTGDR